MTSQQRTNRRIPQEEARGTELLEKELNKLKRLYDVGYELDVRWLPDNGPKEGEVKGNTIFVYSDESNCIKTLWHEFLHYLVSKPSRKYERIVNIQGILIRSLLAQLADDAYREEEKVVDTLVNAHGRIETREGE